MILLSSHILSTLTDICDGIYYIEEGFNYSYYTASTFDAFEIKNRKKHSGSILKQLLILIYKPRSPVVVAIKGRMRRGIGQKSNFTSL